MLFTILRKKGPQITVTSFIEKTSKLLGFFFVGQITLTKKNSMNGIKRNSFFFSQSLICHLPLCLQVTFTLCVPFHSLNTLRTK